VKALGHVLLVLVAALPCRQPASAETPHPFTNWVWSTIDPFGPAAWSITIRTGGYYTGNALWIDGEFNGQLSATQLAELSRILEHVPRTDRSCHFVTDQPEGPTLLLELQYPVPTTRYQVGVVNDRERGDPRLQSISQVAEFLVRLVPGADGRAGTPWRGRLPDEPRGRTRG
jgi:hypothetical protein